MFTSLRARAAYGGLVVLLLAACGQPDPQYLTDPATVMTQSAVAMSELDSLHFAAEISAQVDASALMGLSGIPGASPAPASSRLPAMTLSGTASGGVDFETGRLTASLAIPSLLGFSADLRVADDTAYVRLPMVLGEQWQSTTLEDATGESIDTESLNDPTTITDAITELAATDGVDLRLAGVETCAAGAAEGAAPCYRVVMELDLDQLAAAQASEQPSMLPGLPSTMPAEPDPLAAGSITINLLVDTSNMLWQRVEFTLSHPMVQSLTATLSFSGFNTAVEVEIPTDAVPMDRAPSLTP